MIALNAYHCYMVNDCIQIVNNCLPLLRDLFNSDPWSLLLFLRILPSSSWGATFPIASWDTLSVAVGDDSWFSSSKGVRGVEERPALSVRESFKLRKRLDIRDHHACWKQNHIMICKISALPQWRTETPELESGLVLTAKMTILTFKPFLGESWLSWLILVLIDQVDDLVMWPWLGLLPLVGMVTAARREINSLFALSLSSESTKKLSKF